MKMLIGVVVGVLLGFATYWYLEKSDRYGVADHGPPAVSSRKAFDAHDIKEELSRTGKVVREKMKAAGETIREVADNASTTAAIKAKLLQEPATSGLRIDVDTNDGVVSLSGKVSSHDEIARAMELALETAGVRKVISALQVEEEKPTDNR